MLFCFTFCRCTSCPWLYVLLLLTPWAGGVTLVPSDRDICDITACDALRRIREEMASGGLLIPGKTPVYEESQEDRINKLERRLRSVEQPCKYLLVHSLECPNF